MSEYTKWPRLIVVGEPVTREQANDILIRTDDWRITVNDRHWEATVEAVAAEFHRPAKLPVGAEPKACRGYYESVNAWEASMGVLDLRYMENSRIASSWLGGPHGWCDWDGRIGCSNYNIGKWPDEESCTADWVAIAEAFPYLRLHAQLISDEGEGEVVATWAVQDGKAALVEPAGRLDEPSDDVAGMAFALIFDSSRERGTSVERLREALAQVHASSAALPLGEEK